MTLKGFPNHPTEELLRPPFPWFGGKARAAHLIWPRFGDVPNYVEPFAGGLATLLLRPHEPRCETVNDINAYLVNAWRSIQRDPEAVAYWADFPVNETEMHARHRWLVQTAQKRVRKLKWSPEHYDPQAAGYWLYGQCLWIGSGWCASPQWTGRTRGSNSRGTQPENYDARPSLSAHERGVHLKKPQMDRGGRGVLAPEFSRMGEVLEQDRRPQLTRDQGVHGWEKRPAFKRGGAAGVHSDRVRRPNMGGAGGGQGVHAPRLTEQIPQLSGDGSGAQRGMLGITESGGLYDYMNALSTRLRRVRVCCGNWGRVLTPSVTTYIGLTGVLLDPPYDHDLRSICYSDDHNISGEVRAWALEHGDDPLMRIALCGYQDEHGPHMPPEWECVPWKAGGGYGRSERGKANREQERIWFSPQCLRPSDQLPFEPC